MKELSIEGKATRYDLAIKVAEKYHNGTLKDVMETIFPELKESEGERIRKGLIGYFRAGKCENISSYHGISTNDILDWLEKLGEKTKPIEDFDTEFERQVSCLIAGSINKDYEYTKAFVKWASNGLLNYAKHEIEKQGEHKPTIEMITPEESLGIDSDTYNEIVDECIYGKQKPADKAEPKFHEGDWITFTRKNGTREVLQIYDIRDNRYYFNDNVHLSWSIKECDEKSHLWTIQDAKDGDILTWDNGRYIILFKEIKGNIVAYCSYNTHSKHFGFSSNYDTQFDCILNFSPATKEQRELLFQKMKEAGFKWDAEHKQLRKIEQNPADKVEPKFKVGDIIYKPSNSSCPVHSSIDGTLCTVVKVLDNHYVLDTNEGKIQEPFAWQDYYELVEQKPAWSEEDEEILNTIINHFKIDIECTDEDDIVRWLNRLKERYTWKPSELQIEALESATENCAYSEYQDCLRELIGHLKKLREE